ncbi:hypothetical protein BC629DRAFT_1544456 [Irpex lacteus]|nr:hypothetical protein BC629DRAFT_1544456 [Irpex lacteus]
MTWIKTAGIRREALRCKINVPISTLLLRDGTIHFILLLCMSVTDMILMFFDPSDNNTNIAIYAFRSITLSHFMINLRQVYLECEGNQALGTLRSSSIRFATSVVGNLGAPLSFGTEGSISMDQLERSSNPLAAGLYLGTNNEEDHVLLCEKTHPESPR